EGTDIHGIELHWARIVLITFASGQARVEVYEEDDLDAATARFEELRPHERRLENAASQLYERVKTCFAVSDWDAIAEMLADDICSEDRRRVVNAGLRHGRNSLIAEISSIAEVGVTDLTSEVIATRGGRLALSRGCASVGNQRPEAFQSDLLDIIEIDAD